MLKLNLGCGPIHAAGWVNVDGSRRAWTASRLPALDRWMVRRKLWPPTEFGPATFFADLRRPLPWPDAAVHAIYLGEVLEHLTHADALRLLGECARVARPGGLVRVRVPDNVRFWRNYVTEYDAMRVRPRAEWTDTHARWVEQFFRDVCVRRQWIGSFGHFHKWMWDEVSLTLALERAGFTGVERRAFGDSAIPDVAAVEVREDLTVEAVKPAPAAAGGR